MKLYLEGEVITREGSTDQELLILVDGTVGIFKGDLKVAEFSDEGTILGEMSLILNRPRTATIKAITDSHLIPLSADLYELMKRYPDILKKIIKNLAERLMNLTDEYHNLAVKIDIRKDLTSIN